MRSSIVRTTALALAVPLLIGAGALPAVAASSSVIVKGHVRSPTGKAVPGVRVSIYADLVASSDVVTRTTTSRTGRFEVETPANARGYRYKVDDLGSSRAGTGDGEWATVVQPFTIGGRVNPTVHHGAKISGSVVANNGRPADAGLLVSAVNGTRLTTAYTRRGGVYTFSNLGEGPTTFRVQSPSTNGLDRYFVRGTETGALTYEGATELSLRYGRTATGVDVRFPNVGKITGRVTIDGRQQSGEGYSYETTELLNAKGEKVAQAATKPTFKFKDLAAGTYYLRFLPDPADPTTGAEEYYADSTTLQGATPIVLKAGQGVSGLVAALSSTKAPSPTPAPTATPTPVPTATATPAPTATATATATPTATPSPSVTP